MSEKFKTQVDYRHYNWGRYIDRKRWNSYFSQIDEIVKTHAKRILVIGKGDGFVPQMLTSMGMEVTTFDYDISLKPDILGDVKKLDEYIEPGMFDLILCCEVLEHLPFRYFEDIIKKCSKLKVNYFILSLPNNSCECKWDIKIEIRDLINYRNRKIDYDVINEKFKFRGEHYWEIGVKGTEFGKVQKILSKYFRIKKQFYEFENEYHCFFVLKNKN